MYLVTGGGGFIGSHLVRTLVQRGERVRVLDNNSSGGRERIADVLKEVEWIDGDVRDGDTLHRVCRGVEVILHHAAVASVTRSIAEPEMTHASNVTGTLNVLLAARDAGARRVILASSSAVYGDLQVTPKTEALPTQPLSPYGVQKLAAESYCRIWHAIYGLETVALRYFNVFGPAQDPQSEYAAVIPRFISAVLAGQTPVVYGDGEQSRDFIYISDVVETNLLAAMVPEAAGKVLNVGTGVRVTLNALLAEIGSIVGRPIHPIHEAARRGDVKESLADISLLRSILHYEPAVAFAEGLALTLHAYKEEG
ncbi:MAG TPA: SDR family oxidoreductase [Ktedonobacteraceae bacterium]|nr:SDR family oxidoreductase [Ktedonobacteraceae bacterium]HEU5382379.1 SDR family oxidoreductase [Ktedonobacteraceae bacterium]